MSAPVARDPHWSVYAAVFAAGFLLFLTAPTIFRVLVTLFGGS